MWKTLRIQNISIKMVNENMKIYPIVPFYVKMSLVLKEIGIHLTVLSKLHETSLSFPYFYQKKTMFIFRYIPKDRLLYVNKYMYSQLLCTHLICHCLTFLFSFHNLVVSYRGRIDIQKCIDCST